MEIKGDVKRLVGCMVEMVDLYSNDSPYNIGDKFTIKEAFNEFFDVEENDNIGPKWKTAKLILDEKFLEKFKTENIAINCETEEEAKEYWKENDVAVVAENSNQKENFCIEIDNTGKIARRMMTHPYVCWDLNGWNDFCSVPYPFKTINYKDLKNWREILGRTKVQKANKEYTIKDIKVGDKVLLKPFSEDLENLSNPGIVTSMKSLFGKSMTVMCLLDHTFEVEENEWSWSPSWIEKVESQESNNIENIKTKYKLKDKTITLKDILDKDPCTGEYGKFINEVIKEGHSFKEICKGDIEFTIDELLKYKTVQDNIDWFVKEGLFIEDKFEPFTFSVDINTKEELLTLLKHMNINSVDTEEFNKEYGNDEYEEGYDYEFAHDTWKRLDDIYDEVVE